MTPGDLRPDPTDPNPTPSYMKPSVVVDLQSGNISVPEQSSDVTTPQRSGMPERTEAIVPNEPPEIAGLSGRTAEIVRRRFGGTERSAEQIQRDLDAGQKAIARQRQEETDAAFNAAMELREQSSRALHRSALMAVDQNPETAAEDKKLADAFGVDVASVVARKRDMQRQMSVRSIDNLDLTSSAPILSEFMKDPAFAAMVHDDVPALKNQEGWFSWLGHQITRAPDAFMLGQTQYEEMEYGSQQVLGSAAMARQLMVDAPEGKILETAQGILKQEESYHPELLTRGWLPFMTTVGMVSRQTWEQIPAMLTMGAIGAGVGAAGGAAFPGVAKGLSIPAGASAGFRAGVGVGYAASGLEQGVRQQMGMIFMRDIKAGVPEDIARYNALKWGIAAGAVHAAVMKLVYPQLPANAPATLAEEVATQKLLADKLARTAANPTVSGAIMRIGKESAVTLAKTTALNFTAINLLEGAHQDSLVQAGMKPMTASEMADNVYENMVWMTLGTVGMHLMSPNEHNPILEGFRERSRIAVAKKQAGFYGELMKLAQVSKLATRSPDDAAELIDKTVAGTSVEDVFISKSGIKEAMDAEGLPIESMDELLGSGSLQQYNDPASGTPESGGYVKMSAGEFFAKVAKSRIGNRLQEHVTGDMEIPTVREMKQRVEAQKESARMEKLWQEKDPEYLAKLNAAINDEQANDEYADKVAADTKRTLMEAGDSEEEAESAATLLRAVIVVGANTQGMSTEAWHKLHPMTVKPERLGSERPVESAPEAAATPSKPSSETAPKIESEKIPEATVEKSRELLAKARANRLASETEAKERSGGSLDETQTRASKQLANSESLIEAAHNSRSVGALATELWRLQRRLKEHASSPVAAHYKELESHLRSELERLGVEVADPTGMQWNEGWDEVNVASWLPSEGAEKPLIVGTVAPIVRRNGVIIKRGEVTVREGMEKVRETAPATTSVGQLSREGHDAVMQAVATAREARAAHETIAASEGVVKEGRATPTSEMHRALEAAMQDVEDAAREGDAERLSAAIDGLQAQLSETRDARNAVKQPGVAKRLAVTAQRVIDTAREELDRIEGTPLKQDDVLNQPLRVAVPTAAGMEVKPTDLALPTVSAALPKSTQTAPVQKRVAESLQKNVEVFDKKEVDVKGEKVSTYDSIAVTGTTPEERAESIVKQMTRNLLALYSLIPEHIRKRTVLWYDGANTIARTWSERYRRSAETLGAWDRFKTLDVHHVAGIMAALSPQMAWQTNLSLAERILDILAFRRNFLWSEKMSAWADAYAVKAKDEAFNKALREIRGLALKDVKADDYLLQAIWLRAYDEAHHDKGHRDVSPEGRMLDMLKTAQNKDAAVHWGSFNMIAKAIRIATEQTIESVHEGIGEAHKVRSFYNNIYAPNHDLPFFTSDTHQVAANLLLPVAGDDVEVSHNFGSGGASKNAATGLQGTYFLHAEAGARAADLVGIRPRQMQSATWEVIRAVFNDVFKSKKANKELVRSLWRKYLSGEETYDKTFAEIVRVAGGYQEPSWAKHGPDFGVAPEEQSGSTYRADVPRPERFAVGEFQPRDGVLVGADVPRPDRQREFEPKRFQDRVAANAGNRPLQRDDAIRFVRHQSATSTVDAHGYSQRDRRADDVGTGLLDGVKIVAVHDPSNGLVDAFARAGINAPPYFEIDASGAERFAQAISESKATSTFGAAVYVYPVKEYRNMRLFMSQDGKSGFALKPDGDIVSVFSSGDAKAGMAALQLAIKLGGSKLDAFDTVLPKMYSAHGFKVVARLRWDESQAPSEWNKETFSEFNNGQPDVVFMALDANSFDAYRPGEGEYVESYDAALAKQDEAIGRTFKQEALVAPVSPKFKLWFKDSKAVDHEGQPLKVYHGSGQRRQVFRSQNWQASDKETRRQMTAEGTDTQGPFFFSTKPEVSETYMPPKESTYSIVDADGYVYESGLSEREAQDIVDSEFAGNEEVSVRKSTANPNVRSFYLSVQNPLVIEANGKSFNQLTIADLPADLAKEFQRRKIELGMSMLGDGPTSQVAQVASELGYDGVVFKNVVDIGAHGPDIEQITEQTRQAMTSDVWAVMDSRQIKSTENKGGFNPEAASTLYQDAPEEPRGTFNPRTFEIALTKSRDVTTFWHETSHGAFETYAKMISANTAPEWVRSDFNTLLKWFGVKDVAEWNSLTFEQKRKHYEAFSYNFEIYAAEGKAPSLELQPVFARFKQLVMRVYRNIRGELNEAYRKQFGTDLPILTGEVRQVMDRMLASEEQIKRAQEAREMKPRFQTQEEAGVSDAEWAQYQQALADAHQQAVDELTARSIKDLQWQGNVRSRLLKEMASRHRAMRRDMREKVEEEVRAEPLHRAMDFLKYGMTVDDSGERVPVENPAKLDVRAVKAIIGDEAGAKLGYGKYGMLAKDGMHPDIAAEIFGFDSGEEFVRALAASRKTNDEIEARTDERMFKEHGDLNDPKRMDDAVTAAIHNEARLRAVATEQKFLTGATQPVKVMVDASKEAAAEHINNRKVKDVKPSEFAALAARSGRDSLTTGRVNINPESVGKAAGTREYNKLIAAGVDEPTAIANGEKAAREASERAKARLDEYKKQYGDVDPAVATRRAKQQQLFQMALTSVASDVKQEISDAVRDIRKFFGSDAKIAKTRDIELVMAARSILSHFGFGVSSKPPSAYIEQIRAVNPDLYESVRSIIERTASGPQDYRELTVAEFRALKDAVDALWNEARRDKQVQVDGKKVSLASAVAELMAPLAKRIPSVLPGDRSAPTKREKIARKLRNLDAMMTRVEFWCNEMDGLDKDHGPYTKLIFRRVSEACDNYRHDRNKYIRKFGDLLKKIDSPVGKIHSDALNYTFGVGNGGQGKLEVIGALLHMGNDSNMRKLLLGRKWGELTEEGELDSSRMRQFINEMVQKNILTKADFDFVQSVWDLTEELLPMAQKAHRDLNGHYFKLVEASPFETPFGTYRGGYVPAKVDPFMVSDSGIKIAADALEEGFHNVMPTTGDGFTNQRVANYNRPLALDVRIIGKHIDDVIRYSHVQPAIKDVLRILNNEEFKTSLNKVDPAAIKEILLPWLSRASTQSLTQRGIDSTVDRFWTTVRSRVGLSTMCFALRQLGHVGGIFASTIKTGGFRLVGAMWEYLRNPHEMAKRIASESKMMDARLYNQIADSQEQIERMIGKRGIVGDAEGFARQHGMFLSHAMHNVMDIVTWQAAYNKAINELGAGVTDPEVHREAVARADSAVRMTQGTMAPEDSARFESNTPFMRTMTQFTTYLNTIYNLNKTEYAKIIRALGVKKGAGRLAYAHILAFAAPMIVFEAITKALHGDYGDDEDNDSWWMQILETVFGGYHHGMVGMIPYGGAVVGATEKAVGAAFGHGGYDEHINLSPAMETLVSSSIGTGRFGYKLIAGEDTRKDQVSGGDIRDVMTAMSIASGIPLVPIAKPIAYGRDVAIEKIEPSGNVDFARGLFMGNASPGTRRK